MSAKVQEVVRAPAVAVAAPAVMVAKETSTALALQTGIAARAV